MKIAIYHAWLHCKGGGEKVLLELVEESDHDITIFTNNFVPEDTYDELKRADIRVIGNIPVIGELFRGLSFSLTAMLTKLPLSNFDAFVVSTGGVAEIINYRNHSIPTIGFCHTPLRPVNDDDIYEYKMRNLGFLERNFYRFASKVYQVLEKPAWRFFDHVMFNSETTRERALSSNLIDEERTSVNHPGADTEGNQPGKYQNYFFYPSRFAYYKRQELALKAYKEFKDRNPDTDFRMIVAGGVNAEKEDYFRKISEMAEEIQGAEVRSNVPGAEWKELYRNCYSVVFTAINEDWGIIPIEAGSYEKPIISVNEGGPRESILDGETGFLVDDSPESIADAMEELVENSEMVKEMGEKGRQESRKYTWKKFIQKFDEKVEEVVGE